MNNDKIAALTARDVTEVKWSEVPADLMEQAYGLHAEGSYEERRRPFWDWCESQGIYYYAQPRESFFRFEAFEQAAKEGYRRVLMEDLS